MKRTETILFLTEITFYPLIGGERMRTYGLLKILSNSFEHVHAITGLAQPDEDLQREFPNVTFHDFDYKKIETVIRNYGYFDQFRKDRSFTARIDEVLAANHIDLAFIDYKYYGQYISFLKEKGLKVIYGTHNVQSRIMWQKPAENLKMFVLYKIFYFTHYIHERIYFRKADMLVAVSEHDAIYYRRYIKKDKIVVIPNFLDEALYSVEKGRTEEYIIMTANFLAFQNEVGVSWFLEKVWNETLSKQIKLILAGIGSIEVLAKIRKNHKVQNVEALGKKDDLKGLIHKARLAIVPLLDGSGTRLKCIEAMALKTQLLSTSRGAEGIEHDGSILIADEPLDFQQKILDVFSLEVDTTVQAYDVFMKKYSLAANSIIFQAMLEKLLI